MAMREMLRRTFESLQMSYHYSIKTLDGRRVDLIATDAEDAIRKSGIPRDQIRKWYPWCLGEASQARDNTEATKRLRELRESKKELDMDRKTINKTTGELEADFIRRQLVIEQTPKERALPQGKLRPKAPQTEKPLPLELPFGLSQYAEEYIQRTGEK